MGTGGPYWQGEDDTAKKSGQFHHPPPLSTSPSLQLAPNDSFQRCRNGPTVQTPGSCHSIAGTWIFFFQPIQSLGYVKYPRKWKAWSSLNQCHLNIPPKQPTQDRKNLLCWQTFYSCYEHRNWGYCNTQHHTSLFKCTLTVKQKLGLLQYPASHFIVQVFTYGKAKPNSQGRSKESVEHNFMSMNAATSLLDITCACLCLSSSASFIKKGKKEKNKKPSKYSQISLPSTETDILQTYHVDNDNWNNSTIMTITATPFT